MGEDSLSPALITADLATRFIGQRVIYYPKLASTMDVAREKAQRGAAEGTVIIAEEQTAGKGRSKRVWLSPRGSIALSVILYPSLSYLPYLIMLASLAVVDSIESIAGLKAQLKWPNDVLIDGKKVCGILVESDLRASAVAYAIIGIGINVNLRLADFPQISALATSLADELGQDVSRVEMIRHLLVEMERLYLTLPDGEPVYRAWRDRLVTLGRKVQVKSGKSVLEGTAESVARDGSLLLRHSNGSLTRIVAGDVSLRDGD
jgi:BirA family biotin operon repressor/biotin-[acetyl-CoA-carboxylase] ligase